VNHPRLVSHNGFDLNRFEPPLRQPAILGKYFGSDRLTVRRFANQGGAGALYFRRFF
jgi:hypothetical protein